MSEKMPRGLSPCFYCGKLVPSLYRANHQKYCHKNPESPYNIERLRKGLEAETREGPLDKYLEKPKNA